MNDDDDGVIRFTLSFPVPEGSDPSDPYSMIGNITLHPINCAVCGQGIAEAGVCSDCAAELADEGEPMDEFADLTDDEQRERFAGYGSGEDRD